MAIWSEELKPADLIVVSNNPRECVGTFWQERPFRISGKNLKLHALAGTRCELQEGLFGSCGSIRHEMQLWNQANVQNWFGLK